MNGLRTRDDWQPRCTSGGVRRKGGSGNGRIRDARGSGAARVPVRFGRRGERDAPGAGRNPPLGRLAAPAGFGKS